LDNTKPHSEELFFKNYYTEDWILVDDSANCVINTSDSAKLLNNYMYLNNSTLQYTLDFNKSPNGATLLMANRSVKGMIA